MFDETEGRPHPDEQTPEAIQEAMIIEEAQQCGPVADPAPSHEEIAILAYQLWEQRKDDPSKAWMTDKTDWFRAEGMLSGDGGMGRLDHE